MRLIVGVGYLLCLAPCALSASPALECKNLASLKIPLTTLVSAELVEAGAFKPSSGAPLADLKAFCRVAGIATPSIDSNIKFEVWLPAAEWNGRLWGVGNGSFAGYMPYRTLGAALAEGYATVGTDTGHEAGPTDANWAIGHPEKLVDYAYRGIHEAAVRAKRIVAQFYGRNPARSYFSGCSNGGRQGLMEAQRYPDDYDGILAGAPSLDATHLTEGFAWIDLVVLGGNAANLPSGKLPAIQAAALAACDKLDGVEDGVIDDPRRCRFDPTTLLCKDTETDRCLTEPQLTALKAIYAGTVLPRTGAIIHGYSPGAEVEGWDGWITGKNKDTGFHEFTLGFFGGMVFGNSKWDYHTFDLGRDAQLADKRLAAILNATDADLRKFAAHGGRLILYHGWADGGIQPLTTIDYYNQVRDTIGQKRTAESVRLFMVPGMLHCTGGPGPDSFGQFVAGTGDPNTKMGAALQRWVEAGIAPERIIATKRRDDKDSSSEARRTRPLCAFPSVAHYRGAGSTDDAANFDCAAALGSTASTADSMQYPAPH
jgi:feruloyl esterase